MRKDLRQDIINSEFFLRKVFVSVNSTVQEQSGQISCLEKELEDVRSELAAQRLSSSAVRLASSLGGTAGAPANDYPQRLQHTSQGKWRHLQVSSDMINPRLEKVF